MSVYDLTTILEEGFVRFMVFNATVKNISVISRRSILLVEETGVPGENHRPIASPNQPYKPDKFFFHFSDKKWFMVEDIVPEVKVADLVQMYTRPIIVHPPEEIAMVTATICSCCLALTCISLKPKTRLKYMWTLILSLSLIIGLAVGLGTYGKRSIDTSSSDMRQIRSGLSPRFCSYPLSVYMLPDQPVIQSKNLTSHSYHEYAALEANTYGYWGLYLLKGSYVTISACSKDNGIDYYLVKGAHNLQKWQDDNYCSSCFEIHKSTKDCFHRNSTFTYKIYSSDEYYFIWTNHLRYRSSVTVTLHLNRATYDLSSAIHFCTDSHECSLYYSNEESRESVVIVVPDLDIDNVKIYSTC